MRMIMTRYSYQFYNLKFYHLISLKLVIYRFYNLEYKKLIKIISYSSQLLTDESYKEINQKTFRDEKFLNKLIEINTQNPYFFCHINSKLKKIKYFL